MTHAPAAAGSTVLLRGPFTDSLIVPDSSTSATAHVWFEDRVKPGTYSLLIRAPGYRDWTQTGIRIEFNSCHVTSLDHIVALLQH
ncbi:MAG TPA: carboxypeptidase-like regulatory domain-containing protein [Gemmatimonadaceae bacterium]|nr:carboxypeptidase-like regulatory domain-containing protein [Gemmatimonadaceae bacterium]